MSPNDDKHSSKSSDKRPPDSGLGPQLDDNNDQDPVVHIEDSN